MLEPAIVSSCLSLSELGVVAVRCVAQEPLDRFDTASESSVKQWRSLHACRLDHEVAARIRPVLPILRIASNIISGYEGRFAPVISVPLLAVDGQALIVSGLLLHLDAALLDQMIQGDPGARSLDDISEQRQLPVFHCPEEVNKKIREEAGRFFLVPFKLLRCKVDTHVDEPCQEGPGVNPSGKPTQADLGPVRVGGLAIQQQKQQNKPKQQVQRPS